MGARGREAGQSALVGRTALGLRSRNSSSAPERGGVGGAREVGIFRGNQGCRTTAKALTQRVFLRQRRDTVSEHLDSNAFARVASRRVPGFKRGSRRPNVAENGSKWHTFDSAFRWFFAVTDFQ